MATQVKIKRGTTNANAPTGLTAGEMAINLVDKKLYVGGTGGTNVIFLDSTSSVGLGTANTFTALQTFSAGISASGGVTFASDITVNSMTVGVGGGGIYNNVAVGYYALDGNTTGIQNVAVGYHALAGNTTGIQNIAVGYHALGANTTGSNNVGVGNAALDSNTTGSGNVGVGQSALSVNSSGIDNIAVGEYALNLNQTGSDNIGVGKYAIRSNTTGINNVGVGRDALFSNETGSNKIAIGYSSGTLRGTGFDALTTGTGGIYIGYQARGSTNGQTNEIVIGVDALGLGSNTAVIGATLQSAATIYGLLNLPSGLSAAGATFTGNISAPNIVTVSTANTFTQLNTFSAGISAAGATFNGNIKIPVNTTGAVTIGNHASKNLTLASINAAGEIVQTGLNSATLNIRQEIGNSVSIGDYAGINNNTYINVQDSDAFITINGADLQINGTISTPLVLANAESIKNTVNGRIDFMPGPTAAGAYGLYADFTGWGYGVQMGTINSAGTLDSSPGGILLNDNITILQDKFLSLDSDGTHALVKTTTGLDTLQIAVSSGVGNSNAVAIVGNRYVAAGTANRSPVTSHTNPNLYIYRAGITSANDFIRIEHDGTNGNIVAGGTSGIKISGLLDVASGLSAAGATFSATTASTSSITGAVIIAGGVGIAKDSYINGHRIGQGLSASQTNLAVGAYTLSSTTTGSINNVAVGYYAGNSITSGLGNVMLGAYAGQLNTTGQSNMCIGEGAHYSNQTGSYNVAIGGGAGHEQNNGSVYNVFLGSNAGYFIASGSQTTCVGGDAGRRQADGSTNMTASSDSVYIGYNAKGFNNSDNNTIVIGANAIGLGANKTAIGTSSTTETKLFGVLNLPSGLSAAGATFSGTVNIGTTALISAPSATALAIQSQIPAGTGVTPTIQVICPSAGYTLTNQIATQKVFDLPQDTITLQAATTYMFEGQYLLTTGTTTHITSMSFVLTTATMTNCSWTSITGMPTALNAATSGAFQAIFNSVAGGNVNTTSTSANTMITFKGIMRVNVGGTMVPNIAFSAQPGGTNTVLVGSYLKFYPIGSNTINSVGTAIG